jgi:cysteine desulfurase
MPTTTAPPDLVYLDNAATTPVRPEVREALEPFLSGGLFGNPASVHAVGRAARVAVDKARRRVAEALGVAPRDVVFTSGGTEADNLAIVGAALASRDRGGPFRVAVSAVEHKAVLAAAHEIETWGGEVIVLPVDAAGRVDLEAVDAALRTGVAVLSVMWVNNEVGTVQDVAELAARCAAARTAFHTDAVQAIGKIPGTLHDLPVTLLSLSGHKIGAPKGVGALIVRDPRAIRPLLHGGDQQGGLRPGTENAGGAAALSVAVSLAVEETDGAAAVTRALRERLERGIVALVPEARVHAVAGPRAPHISNVGFPGADSEALLMQLDLAGIACSSGSACASGSAMPSHVLTAMGVPPALATASLRFSFAASNTPADVDRVLAVLPEALARVRALETQLERA